MEVDLNAGAAQFRQQLFSLSNVAPENQKGTNSNYYGFLHATGTRIDGITSIVPGNSKIKPSIFCNQHAGHHLWSDENMPMNWFLT